MRSKKDQYLSMSSTDRLSKYSRRQFCESGSDFCFGKIETLLLLDSVDRMIIIVDERCFCLLVCKPWFANSSLFSPHRICPPNVSDSSIRFATSALEIFIERLFD